MTIGSFCTMCLLLDKTPRAAAEALRRRCRLFGRLLHPPRPAHEFAAAVRTHSVQRVGARCAERAFVAADVCGIGVGGKRPCTSLTAFAHFQCHRLSGHLVSLNSSRPISIRRISDVPAPISYSLASRQSRPTGYSLI